MPGSFPFVFQRFNSQPLLSFLHSSVAPYLYCLMTGKVLRCSVFEVCLTHFFLGIDFEQVRNTKKSFFVWSALQTFPWPTFSGTGAKIRFFLPLFRPPNATCFRLTFFVGISSRFGTAFSFAGSLTSDLDQVSVRPFIGKFWVARILSLPGPGFHYRCHLSFYLPTQVSCPYFSPVPFALSLPTRLTQDLSQVHPPSASTNFIFSLFSAPLARPFHAGEGRCPTWFFFLDAWVGLTHEI